MGPARKSRNPNKRYSSVNEASPVKESENSGRSSLRKRKISDMLGPQWSKEELSRFYEAYRKYNRNWKKIAAAVKHRSVEMVEALFTMNKAYLSLPEGTASVRGLEAMMQDYYSNLASDSDQESNDGVGTSRKPQKRVRGKSQPNNSKTFENDFVSDSPTATPYGFQSMLKKKRTGVTRKRTPRVPIAYENGNGKRLSSPAGQGAKLETATNDDDVTHEIVIALAEASQLGGSPQVSQTPSRRTESVMSSPARNRERKKMTRAKHVDSDIDEEELEVSMEADTGQISRRKGYLKRNVHASSRGKRFDGKKTNVDDTGDNQFDDTLESCSGTEGKRFVTSSFKPSSQGPRKRLKRTPLPKRDEDSSFDALQTLADLCFKAPQEVTEDESTVQIKDEGDHVDEIESFVNKPAALQRDKHRPLGQKTKSDKSVVAKPELFSNKMFKPGKALNSDVNIVPEVEQENYLSKSTRRRPKPVGPKIKKFEAQHPSGDVIEPQDDETNAGKLSRSKRSSQTASPKLTKNAEHSSNTDLRREGSDSAQSAVQVPLPNQTSSPSKVRSKRKTDLKKTDVPKDLKVAEKLLNDRAIGPVASPDDTACSLKKKLSNCLSNHLLRRWCTYEWFYNAIDYPWFAKREFVEYLEHVGLGHIPRLTRVEWGVIRSSLGKPRRFSQQFLKEEKEKLNRYRDSVRTHYTELREGVRDGLPTDLSRPLSVGQHVIAIHPKSREIHDGSVLTVDHSRCRVQFDRPDLGVEFVTDIDCMPFNPMENMPTLLARQFDVDKFFENFNELRMNEQAKDYMKILPSDNLENINGLSHLSPSTFHLKQTKASEDANLQARVGTRQTLIYHPMPYPQPATTAQVQAKEADVQALAKLNRSLDKKEALVSELKRLNDDVVENSSLKESESFKKQYAAVLVQLHDANEQVNSALISLRQRNTYPGTTSLWLRPIGDPSPTLNSLDRSICESNDSRSQVNEIIESSRRKARTMVDVAMQAMSSYKVKEHTKIEEAIDYVNEQLPLDDSSISAAPETDAKVAADKNEAPVPSELISQCVATLLMIQKCTERQFPPADVAQILDSAVTNLKPCCPQNLPVYTEIQKCMGMVKNQILALIPT
ncbi:OLC1v1005995C1 [Oldenlandia corymbosa var. corymbosa]|uniref:OLC1v1005995C1 n=1 Tax=Oldenlandia corymbosa var. corymbosa TaxID=529605 RepID=A0AAV1DI13_OLDCO|nr:OLC1v1005995C1 [Oldenlandia corymbosa var. corymbosa]